MDEKAKIKFDPQDWEGMRKLMEQYGDSDVPYEGVNEQGETILISIGKESITVRTYQNNGWIRRDVYTWVQDELKYGFISETLYEGR